MTPSSAGKDFFQTRQQVWEYYRDPLQQVEDRVRKTINLQGGLIADIGNHILNACGKHFRPLLAIIASNLDGKKNFNEAVILLASAVELIHTASLLHDDVIDQAVKRRNKESARIIWGNKASILVGDYLYAQGVSIAEGLRNHEINDLFLESCRLMTEGETLQLFYHGNLDQTEEEYFRIIQYKTAALISATCRLGAIAAEMNPEKQESLARFGLHLGRAYQIVDDTLDYTGKSRIFGKSICKDLSEGQITLPLLHLLSKCGKSEKKKVEKTLGMDKPAYHDLQQVRNLIKQYKSIDYAINKARESVKAAKEALNSFPDSIHRQALLILADYVLSRDQ